MKICLGIWQNFTSQLSLSVWTQAEEEDSAAPNSTALTMHEPHLHQIKKYHSQNQYHLILNNWLSGKKREYLQYSI